jgi:two-component system, NtrC family, response regulator AtoC
LTQNLNQKFRLLVVSRETAVLRLLHSFENSHPWHCETAASGWDAMEMVQAGAKPGLLILDIARGDADSLHFLRWLRRSQPDLPVVLLCYPDEVVQGEGAITHGAGEILVRPFESKQVEGAIRRQLAPSVKGQSTLATSDSVTEEIGVDALFLSASLITQKLRSQAALMAKADVPVLILGEPGAGKFAVASLIHSLSVRSGFKLRRLHCADMPESLLEAELFPEDSRLVPGHAAKFGAGEKGTLYLDEITALPAALQSRLAQLLQEDELRNGKPEAASANVRILTGSSADLDRAVAEKRLREDLYFRLSAFTIQVPSLRQRNDEIGVLLCYFMHKLAKHYSLPPRGFSAQVVDVCQRYSWPGNLKEMETFVKRYLVAGDEEAILQEIGLTSAQIVHHSPPQPEWRIPAASPGRTTLAGTMTGQNSQPESLKSLIQGVKSEAEQNAIGAALQRTGWNRKAAARLLRVSYRTLLYKIDQYRMRAPEPYFSALPIKEFSDFEEVKGNGKAS